MKYNERKEHKYKYKHKYKHMYKYRYKYRYRYRGNWTRSPTHAVARSAVADKFPTESLRVPPRRALAGAHGDHAAGVTYEIIDFRRRACARPLSGR